MVGAPSGLLSVSVLMGGVPGAKTQLPATVSPTSAKTSRPIVRSPSSVTGEAVLMLSVPKSATLPAPPAIGPAPLFQFAGTPQLPDASPPAFFVQVNVVCARAASGAAAASAATTR